MTRASSLTRRQRSTLCLAIRVVFLLALVILSATCPALHAQGLSESGLQETRAALAAAQSGDWNRAYASVAATGDMLPLKIIRWMDYSRPGAPGRFADIAEFIEKNPDWPRQKALSRHAEEALSGESDAVAADWFRRRPPVSGIGKAREAEIMLGSGSLEGGTAALRAAWIDADFGPGDEKAFLARHDASIRPEDHERRLDRLLWEGQQEAARRMFPLVPADWRSVAEIPLALVALAPNAEFLTARVPTHLRSDPGITYEELRWCARKDMVDGAVRILLSHPGDPVRPAAWWVERQSIARRLLSTGNAELAYRIAAQHGLIEGNAYSEAEFLLGYIALRYMKNPADASDH